MTAGTISVVIPTFNSSSTIQRALDSVAAQTLLPAEIIVVDNASTDDTVEIIRQFAKQHLDIRCSIEVLTQNLGPGAARNHGWDRASGDLIAFLDSDDSWHPEKLARQRQITFDYPKTMLFGHQYEVVQPGGQPVVGELSKEAGIDFFVLSQFLIRNRVSTPTVMVRRNVSERFPSTFWHGEDYALWLAIVAKHGPAVVLRQSLTYLHKPAYGASGLSADMKRMHQGELLAVQRLRTSGDLSHLRTSLAVSWMRLKYLHRLVKMARRV